MPKTRDMIADGNFSLKAIETEYALEIFPYLYFNSHAGEKFSTEPASEGIKHLLFITLTQEAADTGLAENTVQSTMKTKTSGTYQTIKALNPPEILFHSVQINIKTM